MSVSIKDGLTVKFVFDPHTMIIHDFERDADPVAIQGTYTSEADDNTTVIHKITIIADIIDGGTYDEGEDPGTTGTIWKQSDLLLDNVTIQASTDSGFTLAESEDTQN